MIELSLDTLSTLSDDLNTMDDDSIEQKYNFDLKHIEDSVSDYVDEQYLNTSIYHLCPIIIISTMMLNYTITSFFL
jgi:conjugal transfer/entry exclusion protein